MATIMELDRLPLPHDVSPSSSLPSSWIRNPIRSIPSRSSSQNSGNTTTTMRMSPSSSSVLPSSWIRRPARSSASTMMSPSSALPSAWIRHPRSIPARSSSQSSQNNHTPTMTTAIKKKTTTIDSLMQLLKRVRRHDPNVQHVCIENRRLPAKYVVALLHAVSENKYVTKLKLCKVDADDGTARAVASCLRNSTSLTIVNLSKNKFSDAGCRHVANALRDSGARSVLRRLNLEQNNIGDNGIDQLCRAVPAVPSLTAIKLGKNNFGIKGLRSMALLLCHTTCLQSLDLRLNRVGNQGACILADALAHNRTLLYLYLNSNDLGNRGVKCLAAALTHNQHLRTLDLQRNDFDDLGAAAFVQALGKNDSFIRLKIRHTAVTEDVKSELLDLLLMNSYGPDLARRTKLAMAQLQLVDDTDCTSADLEQSECVICYDNISDCALLPCQHCNCCMDCGKRLKGCHMCRSEIVKVVPLHPAGRTMFRAYEYC